MSINDWLRTLYHADMDDTICEQLLQFQPTLKAEYIRELGEHIADLANHKVITMENDNDQA